MATSMLHSSLSSRRSASTPVSPNAIAPPGNVQAPNKGACPRRHEEHSTVADHDRAHRSHGVGSVRAFHNAVQHKRRLTAPRASSTTAAMMTLEECRRIELRVGTVVKAQRVAGTRKLLRLQVKLAEETRQIMVELAQFYEPEELLDKQVIVVANVQPGLVNGERSYGKLLVVHGAGEILNFATVDRVVNDGALVR